MESTNKVIDLQMLLWFNIMHRVLIEDVGDALLELDLLGVRNLPCSYIYLIRSSDIVIAESIDVEEEEDDDGDASTLTVVKDDVKA